MHRRGYNEYTGACVDKAVNNTKAHLHSNLEEYGGNDTIGPTENGGMRT